jgi:DNA end-binding protein Ku
LTGVSDGSVTSTTWQRFGSVIMSSTSRACALFGPTDTASSISFNQLHGECQTRIQQKKWCPYCDREVASSEIVKGYEFSKGRYVVMDDEDLSKVRPPSTRVIDLVQFADAGQLDPIYFDRPYYLAPDGDVAGSSFAVMREGNKRSASAAGALRRGSSPCRPRGQ